MIRQDQSEAVSQRQLNMSGLVRDLLDDYFGDHSITITVSEETKALYDQIVSNTGSNDSEVEKYLKKALKELLTDRIKAMQQLQDEAF